MENQNNQNDLDNFIKKELNKYKKPQNKTKEFEDQLMQKAMDTPSHLWAIFAPTNKLKAQFDLVENQLMANKWLNRFKANEENLDAIIDLSYEMCLIRDGKTMNGLNEVKVNQWEETFMPVMPDFKEKFNQVVEKWNEWHQKTDEEKAKIISDLSTENKKLKMK